MNVVYIEWLCFARNPTTKKVQNQRKEKLLSNRTQSGPLNALRSSLTPAQGSLLQPLWLTVPSLFSGRTVGPSWQDLLTNTTAAECKGKETALHPRNASEMNSDSLPLPKDLKKKYLLLFIWLCWVLGVASRIFSYCMWDLVPLTRDWTQAFCLGSKES